MSIFWIIFTVISILIVGVLIYKALHQIHYPGPKQNKGTKPGSGDTLVEGGFGATGGSGGGYSAVTRVTKDPQGYAKGMMPKK